MKRPARRGSHGRARAEAAAAGSSRPLDVTVVLLEGGYASTAVGPIEVFHSAGLLWNWLKGEPPEPRFRVTVASPGGRPVKSICNMSLSAERALEDVERSDIVIVPASGWDVQEKIARHTHLLPWLRRMHDRGACVAAVCTGAVFLAEAGLLDGREATTHWAVADILRQRHPKVRWQPDKFVTEDGRVLCSGGVYASIDLSLHLVEKFCGHEIALQCAKALLVSLPRSRQSGYSVLPVSRPHADERIRRAEEHLQKHFREKVGIESLAERCTMSPRNFIRRFKAATGRLPGEYVQMMRVSAARAMLESGVISIQAVGLKVGYEDAGFFRSLFKRHTGMTPGEYRVRFAQLHHAAGELGTGAAE
jgi:transcriptional regulator GlxA family with amidase domain